MKKRKTSRHYRKTQYASQLQLPEAGFVRLPAILNVIPISSTAWYRGIAAGYYPRPVALGERTAAWRVDDIKKIIKKFEDGTARTPWHASGS